MKFFTCLLLILFVSVIPVSAAEYTAPEAPESIQQYLPEHTETFSDGLWYIVKQALKNFNPDLAEGMKLCLSMVACVLIASILQSFTGVSKETVELVAILGIAILLLESTNSMIRLGTETVREISAYGKLLVPVMTAALAAQGGAASSAALYTGTAFFNSVLSGILTKLIVPFVYIYLVLCIAYRAIGDDMLKNLCETVKWFITWTLKTVLYIFTGYLGITGVVSGATDAAALKAAKLTISGAVPVVGSIISDASEAVLVGMRVVINSAGMYGLLVIVAIGVGPFIKIGMQYLLLKLTSTVCSTVGSKQSAGIIGDFAGIMGVLLAITGTICLLFLISIVCFIKGGT